jgi:phage terminase large subunit
VSAPTIQLPEAFADLFIPSRYKAFWGGRGSAKSHSLASALLIMGADRPLRVLCAREIQKSIKDSVKRLLDDKIAAFGYGGFYSSTDNEIRGRNGTLFIFDGLRTNPQSIKSLEGLDISWVEEANTASQTSLDFLIPTVRKPGSEIWFSWNPDKETDPVDKMFRGANPPPDSIIREVNHDANPWFPDVLRKEMEWDRLRDTDKYLHVWRGKYRRRSSATVFKNWTQGIVTIPPDCKPLFGADWGFATDPTVLVRAWMIDARTLYIDREVFQVGCEIDDTPALFQTLNDERVTDIRKWLITADSARPETISFMNRHGFNIVGAVKGAGSVEEGVSFLKSVNIIVHPACKHTIGELEDYSYKIDKLTNDVLPVLEDKKNHVIDSLRYALEATRRAYASIIEFYRLQAQEIQRPGQPAGAQTSGAMAAGVRLRAPDGISVAYGLTGTSYVVDEHGFVTVGEEDAIPLKSAGFRDEIAA